ncbi:MAG TPA: DUF2784 domain-containing protein [Novimethylophilus sp.]|jgi:hypothetical protein|uniref:DUF2784 domain-containing protein n=1 Tax=Novimethylophilus sp. TaxID=2137426 RepID=UPI002F42A032
MPYSLLADAVLLLHLGFILFVAFGGFAVLRRPRLAWLHLPAVLWGIWIEYAGWICPLTPLENQWRRMGGETGYGSDFIGHYLTAMIYPQGLTRSAQIVLGTLVLAVNAAVYWRLWRRRQAGRAKAHP